MRGVTESAVSDIYRHIDNVSFINLSKSLLFALYGILLSRMHVSVTTHNCSCLDS